MIERQRHLGARRAPAIKGVDNGVGRPRLEVEHTLVHHVDREGRRDRLAARVGGPDGELDRLAWLQQPALGCEGDADDLGGPGFHRELDHPDLVIGQFGADGARPGHPLHHHDRDKDVRRITIDDWQAIHRCPALHGDDLVLENVSALDRHQYVVLSERRRDR